MTWEKWLLLAACTACESSKLPKAARPDGVGGAGNEASGGMTSAGGTGGDVADEPGGPSFHPPPGFESCVHSEVRADCEDGWCRIPAGCFVMGSPEGQWGRADLAEQQVEATLTRAFLLQRTEMTRRQWLELVGLDPGVDPNFPDEVCLEDDCPVTHVTWWDAVHAANLLSDQDDLSRCYSPVNCTGVPGNGLACEGVTEPEKLVYECEGYRLPTRHEFEYSAKAGTTTSFYSGEITVQSDRNCHHDIKLGSIAWYCENSGGKPHVTAQLNPNGFGLFDTIGNAMEWLNDPYGATSSPGGNDPQGGVGSHSRRLLAPGAYNSTGLLSRAAGRGTAAWDARASAIGVRLARTLHEGQ